MKVYTKDEATTVVRAEVPKPWKWPDPVIIMISNSGPVIHPLVGYLAAAPDGAPFEFAVALNMLESLYRYGYAVVKLDAEGDAAGDLTRAELFAKLKAEHEDRLDDAVELGEAAEAIAWAQNDAITAERQRGDTFMRERDEARKALRELLYVSHHCDPGTGRWLAAQDKARVLLSTEPQEARHG